MNNKGEQYGPGWAYIALMVHENGEIHAVGGDRRGDDPEADLHYIGLERLEALMGQQQSGFSCAKRAADPQNEFAACNQWCGDSQRCMTGFDTAKFFRHVDAILGMDEWQRENSTFGAREATPELMAAIRAVTEIEGKTRRSMFGALSEHKQITNAPEVSSEHIQALAKMCGLIPSHTTAEWVSTLVRFVRVVLDSNSVQEAFVRANAGLLAAPAPNASPETMVHYGGGETPISFEDGASPVDTAEEDAYVIDRLGKLLAGVAIALKGPDLAQHRHSYHDLVEVAEKMVIELDLYRATYGDKMPAEASASPAALTDEQIIALADRGEYLTPSPSKYPQLGHGTQYHCGAPGLLGFARALLAASPADQVDEHPDDAAVDRFAAAMKAKMAASREKGRAGWDDAEQCSPEFLARSLIDHLYKGDPVDVGNFVMMLFNRPDAGRALAEAAPHAAGRDIAGALFDFCGHLTSMPRTIVLGASHLATPCADELREWAAKRNLSLHPADVERWNAAMSASKEGV